MRFGINTFLFTSPFTNESAKYFKDFKTWGFESVEIPLEQESHIIPSYIKSELKRYGLACGAMGCAVGPGRDLRGTCGGTTSLSGVYPSHDRHRR